MKANTRSHGRDKQIIDSEELASSGTVVEKCMSKFIPGRQLSEVFYRDAVKLILEKSFPGLAHSAALIGYGWLINLSTVLMLRKIVSGRAA